MTDEEAKTAILLHLDRLNGADLILIYNKNGYLGMSVVMELGYAYALRKPIYAIAPISDPFLAGLVTAVIDAEAFIRLART